MSLNVNRSVSDQFYRYKMPRLIAKVGVLYICTPRTIKANLFGNLIRVCFSQVEGKGNGIKTVIVNMVDVAKALNRPPTCEHCTLNLYSVKFGLSQVSLSMLRSYQILWL